MIALVGDGAMQMNGLAELITISHYWSQWADPRLIVAILHNNDLNQVTWEMRAMSGAPKFAESQTLPDVDYAGFARSLGLAGVNIDDPDELGSAWTAALAATRPTVLDVICDPDVPPIPPHATFEQVKGVAGAVLHGDEDAWGFVKQGVKQKVQQYLPGFEGRQVMSVLRRAVSDVRTGRFERSLSAVTAAGAAITAAEIYLSHDGASFGNKMMWWPVVVVPTAIPAGIAAVFSARAARTVLPLTSAAIVINGVQGTYLHWRGIAQRPGGWTRYNMESGPPMFAPLLASLVGGMGLVAAVLRRERYGRP